MKKKILALCLAVLTVVAAFAVFTIAEKAPAVSDPVTAALDAECRDENGIIYTLDENTNTAIVGKGVYAESDTADYRGNGTIVIPDTVTKDGKTYTVREIGKNAFSNSNPKEVIISNSVTKIGELAFANCEHLEKVTMGSGVTDIAGFAFWHCPRLTDVSLGQNVKTIGGAAFWSCPSLEVITLPQGLTTVMEQAFKDCTNLRVVYKAEATAVAANAFEGIEKAPEIKSEYTPALYINKVYVAETESQTPNDPTVRVLLEGCAANVDLSQLKVNGAAVTASAEIGDSVYNGTVYSYTVTPDDAEKDVTAALGELSATMKIVGCKHEHTEQYLIGQSCTKGGYRRTVCADCHNVIGSDELVEKLGHDYVDFTVEPVCVDGGYTTHRCARCGEVTKDSYTEATGHSFNDGDIRSMPTHNAKGLKRYTCDACKRVEDVDLPVVGDANGDGSRDAKDVILIMRYIIGVEVGEFYVESANANGDLDENGKIDLTVKDIIMLMRAIIDNKMVLPSTPMPQK